jgi:hypothetical protein
MSKTNLTEVCVALNIICVTFRVSKWNLYEAGESSFSENDYSTNE